MSFIALETLSEGKRWDHHVCPRSRKNAAMAAECRARDVLVACLGGFIGGMHPIKDRDSSRKAAPAECRVKHIVVEFLLFYACCRDALLMPCRTITGLETSNRHMPDENTATYGLARKSLRRATAIDDGRTEL